MAKREKPNFVTHEECRAIMDSTVKQLDRFCTKLNRLDLSLFGTDGRGGIQNDITKLLNLLEAEKKAKEERKEQRSFNLEQKNFSLTRLSIYVGLLSAGISSVISWLLTTLC